MSGACVGATVGSSAATVDSAVGVSDVLISSPLSPPTPCATSVLSGLTSGSDACCSEEVVAVGAVLFVVSIAVVGALRFSLEGGFGNLPYPNAAAAASKIASPLRRIAIDRRER